MSSAPRIGFDVGNTRIKAAWCEGGAITRTASIGPDAASLASDLDQFLAGPRPRHALVATVNPPSSDRLVEQLRARGIEIRLILSSDGSLFAAGLLGCAVETPQTTGVDRLLAALAARQQTPGRAVIVVDAGSAITVSLTSSAGVFEGGAILPGFGLMADALRCRTAALPSVELDSVPAALGRSTRSAIAAGIYFAATGGVERIVEQIRPVDEPVEIHVTGGNDDLLSTGLRLPHRRSPNLVLAGLFLAADRLGGAVDGPS